MGAMNGDMGSAMSMPLLPPWLRVVWVVALAGVVVVHVGHAWSMRGQPRWWHTGHTLMALGMMLMYLTDRMAHPGLYRAGLVFFGLLTVLTAATALALRRREDVLNPLWVASVVDMLAMTYMLLPPTDRPSGLTFVFVAYLVCHMLAWALALWSHVPMLRCGAATLAPAIATSPGPVPSAAPVEPVSAGSTVRVVGLPAECTPTIRISLAVMLAAMAYMLAIM